MVGFKGLLAAFLLTSTAVAGPVFNAVDKRDDCPIPTLTTLTFTSPTSTHFIALTTLTEIETVTAYGRKTKTITRVFTSTSTRTKFISIPTTTSPSTTAYEWVAEATVTTNPYGTFFDTTVLPGTPSPCYVQTCISLVFDETTSTFPSFYNYVATTVTLPTATSTVLKIILKHKTVTETYAGTTIYLSTSTSTFFYTSTVVTVDNIVQTNYATPGPTCG
ncbi:hypothetical protein ABW20_dc0103673 [Dactylellina cionopaga]|nr:hypothetical protein ABW20_dc0103673 [Dactylellina cionopaga]